MKSNTLAPLDSNVLLGNSSVCSVSVKGSKGRVTSFVVNININKSDYAILKRLDKDHTQILGFCSIS